MMKTFSIGGIHPSDSKISKDCKIEVLPVPSKVFISVAQHLGAPATPVVKAGDQVKAGQIIAEPAGFMDSSLAKRYALTFSVWESLSSATSGVLPTSSETE